MKLINKASNYLPPTEEITVTPFIIAFSPIMVVKFFGSIWTHVGKMALP